MGRVKQLYMCGIIGIIASQNITPLLLDGLRRESYRGYDSSGIVIIDSQPILVKAVGQLEKLEEKILKLNLQGHIGLGHNRWATHGGVTEDNAHPHRDCQGDIYITHNGIIENFEEIKDRLIEQGHTFISQTDSEVLAHLIEHFYEDSLEQAVRQALQLVRGTYGLVAVHVNEPDKLVVARLGSPIVIAVNPTAAFVASDPAALAAHVTHLVFLDDREIAVIEPGSYRVADLFNRVRYKNPTKMIWKEEESSLGSFAHFMLKEIHEQPISLRNALRGRLLPTEGIVKLGGLHAVTEQLQQIERLSIIACGTAHYAGRVGKYMLEEIAGIPTDVEIASEYRYRQPVVTPRTASLVISQSGETADTLAAVQMVKDRGELTLGIINVVGSTIARTIDAGLYTYAGPEIGVASTKAFTSQLAVLALLTVYLGRQRGLSAAAASEILQELQRLPEVISHWLMQRPEEIQAVAAKLVAAKSVLYVGRKYSYPVAMEGALKLKEVSYIHAEGYSAGELKHGAIALIDPDTPTVAICPQDSVYDKTMSNLQEIKSRSGPIIAIATEGDTAITKVATDVIFIPRTAEMLTPILSVIPLQLLAYYAGLACGSNVDKPRNLAKSVTVE